jgi:hypothetical protein
LLCNFSTFPLHDLPPGVEPRYDPPGRRHAHVAGSPHPPSVVPGIPPLSVAPAPGVYANAGRVRALPLGLSRPFPRRGHAVPGAESTGAARCDTSPAAELTRALILIGLWRAPGALLQSRLVDATDGGGMPWSERMFGRCTDSGGLGVKGLAVVGVMPALNPHKGDMYEQYYLPRRPRCDRPRDLGLSRVALTRYDTLRHTRHVPLRPRRCW